MSEVIDLRSDTVTKPCAAMLQAMMDAETGDDVYGEDPTVNALETFAASLCGKEAALFATSGTQSNLLGILSHCERGDEYIAGSSAHTYQFEGGGAAVLGSVQPCTVDFNERGELPLQKVRSRIKPNDFHFARTRLLCLENTQAGKVLDLSYLAAFSDLANEYKLMRHLDGARLFNAVVHQGVETNAICEHFDTISICLSKGLGAPMGSLLVGDAETIQSARRWRKVLGGGLRQAGYMAAAGLFALQNNIKSLSQDHENATFLYENLSQLPGFEGMQAPETNMLHFPSGAMSPGLIHYLSKNGIRVSGPRWVLHRDIAKEDVQHIIAVCTDYK